jgi:hypothetical protein
MEHWAVMVNRPLTTRQKLPRRGKDCTPADKGTGIDESKIP